MDSPPQHGLVVFRLPSQKPGNGQEKAAQKVCDVFRKRHKPRKQFPQKEDRKLFTTLLLQDRFFCSGISKV